MRAAEAAVASARLDLQFTQVRAPIAGRAGRALVTDGNLAQADATLLTTRGVARPGARLLRERRADLPALQRAGAQGRAHAIAATRCASAWPTKPATRTQARSTSSTTRSIRAPARSARAPCCAIPTACSRPGLFARVQLEGSARVQGAADRRQGRADRPGPQVRLRARPEERGACARTSCSAAWSTACAWSTSGLTPQDKVIVHGVQKVFFPGMPVAPKQIAMGAPPSAQVASAAGAK